MSLRVLPLLTLLAAAPAAVHAAPQACAPSTQDRLWMQGAVDAWFSTAHDRLGIYAGDPPDFVFFDGACAYRTGSTAAGARYDGPRFAGRRLDWRAAPHGGEVALPGGGAVPARVVSFASPYDRDRQAFMVMGLPDLWRAGGVRSGMGLETMMTAVFIHEMTHTRQFYAFAPRMAALTAKYGLPNDISDDTLQETFKDDRDYVAAFEAERALLLRAVAADDDAEARRLAAEALASAKARRARFFTGDKARWAELEDTFLTLEGVGQWAAWAWLTDPKGGALPADRALPLFRRNGRFWSQDEGLLVMILVDRLVPNWRERAFAAEPAPIFALWETAAA